MTTSDEPAQRPGRVWLAGLMASGKSTVGRELARRRGWPYVDNDASIQAMAGQSSVALAAQGGAVLHEWEARLVAHLVGLTAPVVAGIPASIADRPDDLQLLRRSGLLVFLRCDLDTLVRRVAADPPRPWLGADVRPLLRAMVRRRDPVLTAVAHLVLDATQPVGAVVDRIELELDTAGWGRE